MRRHLLALAAGATLLAGMTGGTALAQETDPPATGPDTAACASAREALAAALVDVEATIDVTADLDVISDQLAELGTGTAGVSAALALVGDARTACTAPTEPEPTPAPTETPDPTATPEPGGNEPQPGDACSTDDVDSGILGATGGPTTTPAPVSSGTNGSTSGGQVGTVPRGYADTGAL